MARLCLVWIVLGSVGSSLHAETGPTRKVIHQYALTSANDFPQRDPEDWRLLGSNDNGKSWTVLDERSNEVFTERHQRKLYAINNEMAFATYRLEIEKVHDPSVVNSIQLAELELMGRSETDLDPTPAFTDLITARGDNPPAELVANLFDGHVETKWLDWPTNYLTRASWVQWQYTARSAAVITNLSQLFALRVRADDGYFANIQAMMAGRVPGTNPLCFVDSTGCIELGDIAGMSNIVAGQRVRITGISKWADGKVGLQNLCVQAVDPNLAVTPETIVLGQQMKKYEDLKWVEVQGEIRYRRLMENEFAFDLQSGDVNMRVHLRGPDNSQRMPPAGTHVSVRGVCRGAFNEQGEWVAECLWAAGWNAMSLVDQTIKDKLPAASPLSAKQLSNSPAIINTIEPIRRLTAEQIQSHPRVKIRGVVTGQLGGFVQDETAGIEVTFPSDESRKITDLGAYVEVEGIAALGDAGNHVIIAEHVTALGRGRLPQPQHLSLTQLMSGRMDAQWIEVEGVVRSTDGSHLLLICYGRELMATVVAASAGLVDKLVDAEVRVRGVAVTAMDEQGRIQGIHLLIPSLEHLEVIVPPAKLNTLPVQPIGKLLGLSGPRDSFHRVKVEGYVTLKDNQRIFLQDDTGSAMAIFKEAVVLDSRFGRSRWLYWRLRNSIASASAPTNFSLGDKVEVTGFATTHGYSPVITEVSINKIGPQKTVLPIQATSDGIEEGGLDSSLITLDGMVRGQNSIGSNIVLALEWQDRILQIMVPAKDGNELAGISVGSRLRVTGICQIDPAPFAALGLGVGAVKILTRSPQDLTILAQPPWWTPRKALALMGGMAFTILAALFWIRELHRRVGERTKQLTKEIHLREQTEHQYALDQERARIAEDLHDDLGANLTQIVFLSERVSVARQDGQDVNPWFERIPDTARRTIRSLDEIVWAINPRHDTLESLANYLSQFAQEHLNLARIRCVLEVPTVLPALPLSAELRHNLLLSTREALQNAVTHANATEVRLELKLDGIGLSLIVSDNGRGFVIGQHTSEGNGLSNIRKRLENIGGRLEINSTLGKGTIVTMFVPLRALHDRVIGGNGSASSSL